MNSSRVHLRAANAAFAQSTPQGAMVLDAGSGTAPYRDLFAHTTYETADLQAVAREFADTTYVCDLTAIPVEDARFDRVLFNQVLEHVPEPLAVLRELHRVMKPGGVILCSCPLFYEEHEQPYDFYRYTRFAHRYLFEAAGFEIRSIGWLEGVVGTAAYELAGMYRWLPIRPKNLGGGIVGWLAAPVMACIKIGSFVLAGVFYRIDIRHRYEGTGHPKNYLVIAVKPET